MPKKPTPPHHSLLECMLRRFLSNSFRALNSTERGATYVSDDIFRIIIKSELSALHLNTSQHEAKNKVEKYAEGYPGSREPLYSSSSLDHCSKLEKLTVFDRQIR